MRVVENRAARKTFLKARFAIFRCQKYVKKGYMEIEKWIYPETLKLCLIYILTQKYIICVQYAILTQCVIYIGLILVGVNNYFYDVFSSIN